MDSDLSNLQIQATDLVEYLFCPRFTYYEHVLNVPEHEHLRKKVLKGRRIHELKRIQNRRYLRKKIGCVGREFQVYLSSPKHHILGIVDEILHLQDGDCAVMDYKFAEFKKKVYRTHRWQLVFYSLLVKTVYDKDVKRAFLLYTRNKKMVEIKIRPKDYETLQDFIADIVDIIGQGKYPKETKQTKKCADCCYRNICPSGVI